MKDKLKNLKNIDFLTELTPSEQEQINGGGIPLTSSPDTDPNGRSTGGMLPPPPEPTPPPQDSWNLDTRYQDFLKV